MDFPCTNCKKVLRVPDTAAGRQAKCPQCGTVMTIPAPPPATPSPAARPPASSPVATPPAASPAPPPTDPPAAAPSAHEPDDDGTFRLEPVVKSPSYKPVDTSPISAPATVQSSPPADQLYDFIEAENRVQGPAMALMIMGAISLLNTIFWLVFFGSGLGYLGLVIYGLQIFGGFQMLRLQNYPLAMTGAVFAILPIPYFPYCCVLTMPVGIWAAIVLADPGIRAAFEQGPNVNENH